MDTKKGVGGSGMSNAKLQNTMISIGVILVAFAAYEMSGTGASTLWGANSSAPTPVDVPQVSGKTIPMASTTIGSIAGNLRGTTSFASLSGPEPKVPPVFESDADRESVVRQLSGAKSKAPVQAQFRAFKHAVSLSTPREQVPKLYDAITRKCVMPTCEVLSASLSTQQTSWRNGASAAISLRIVPDGVDGLLKSFGPKTTIVQHKWESTDKTSEVVDVEARIKNLTILRDQLREAQASMKGSVKDSLEAARELANVQTELDGVTGMRALLAKQTEMVEVLLDISEPEDVVRANEKTGWQSLKMALGSFGDNFVNAMSFIIVLLSFISPIAVVIGLAWLAGSFYRRFRKNKGTTEVDGASNDAQKE